MNLMVKLKKLHPDAVIPSYAKPGDAGVDLTAISEEIIRDREMRIIRYGTGLSIEIPSGYVGLIFPRSSITTKTTLLLGNHVGVIDSGYRGEIKFEFRDHAVVTGKKYNVGDRIGQLIIVPYPTLEFLEVTSLSETERSSGGFGSSGS